MDSLLIFLPGIAVAYSILFFGALSPGPAVAMLVGLSLEQGRSAALIACLGFAMASVVLNTLTILGVGLILSQAAWAMMALKLIRSAYLAYLAWGAFKKALHPPQIDPVLGVRDRAIVILFKGFVLQVTNPKAIGFWLAIAAVGATTNAPIAVIVLFIIGGAAISYGCHAVWAVALSATPVRSAFNRARRYIEATLGAFFAFAAVTLVTSRS